MSFRLQILPLQIVFVKVVVDLNDFQFELFQGGWNSDTYKRFLEFVLKSSMKFGNLHLLGGFEMEIMLWNLEM